MHSAFLRTFLVAALFLTGEAAAEDDGTWSELVPDGLLPTARSAHSAIYDPLRDRLIVFGGWDGTYRSDVWELRPGHTPTWTELLPTGTAPSGRYLASTIYDPIADRMIIFGGRGDQSYLDDTWELSFEPLVWTQLNPTGPVPPLRSAHAAVYDAGNAQMIVFGGAGPSGGYNDVWALDLTGDPEWSQLSPSGTPPTGRYAPAGVYDPVRQQMIIFGGYDTSDRNDTWVLSQLDGIPEWTQLTPPADPLRRREATLTYDPIRDRMILYGGYHQSLYYRGDVWELDLTVTPTWTRLAPEEPGPGARTMHAAAYDPFRDQMLVFGGKNGPDQLPQSRLNDTWGLNFGAPILTQATPDEVTRLDTGIDVVLDGHNFDPDVQVFVSPVSVGLSAVKWWSSTKIHLRLNLDEVTEGENALSLIVQNPGGQQSTPLSVAIQSLSVPHPRDFAPTFWFAPAENWYPTSPFFENSSGSTLYDSPQEKHTDYLSLDEATKKANVTVYYHVYGDSQGESFVPFPHLADTRCRVYEFWLYFTFDEYTCGSVLMNRHYHDWEKFFVFVGAHDGLVRGVAGRAHLDGINASNVYEFVPPLDPGVGGFHPTVLVELGGHATCPDVNSSGVFEYENDVNGCAQYASWGIADGVLDRDTDDRVFGPGVGSPSYNLASLDELRSIVDPLLTSSVSLWEGSREEFCTQSVCPHLFPWDLVVPRNTVTFTGSPVAPTDPASSVVRAERTTCPCWDESRPIVLGHSPIEHAWQGQQGEYLSDPRKILPGCYSNLTRRAKGRTIGVPGSICDAGFLVRYAGSTLGKLALDSAVEMNGDAVFGYAPIGDDGSIAFWDCPPGIYGFAVPASGAAPYWQTLVLSDTDTLLGASGDIILVADNQYFIIRCSVKDSDLIPLPGAQIKIWKDSGELHLPTLSNLNGEALVTADTSDTYKITLDACGYRDSILGIAGTYAETLSVDFSLPFSITAVEQGTTGLDGPGSSLRSYPSPFRGSTVLAFHVPQNGSVSLEIFDIRGRLVRKLVKEERAAGDYRESWDGRTADGRVAPSGVYLCRLLIGERTEQRKLVVLR